MYDMNEHTSKKIRLHANSYYHMHYLRCFNVLLQWILDTAGFFLDIVAEQITEDQRMATNLL